MPRRLVFILYALVLAACQLSNGSASQPAPTIDKAAIQTDAAVTAYTQFTQTASVTVTPSVTPKATVKPTATHIPHPTIVPTINPTEVPGLLQSSLKVETLAAFNGHNLRKVTGWGNGFNSGLWDNDYEGYQWMDSKHLLLFPVVGELMFPNWKTTYMRAAVINLETGKVWLPPSDQPEQGYQVVRSLLPRWSKDLQILITSQISGGGYTTTEGVSTYTANGDFITRYWGELVDVSPSGNKVLIADDSWIDLSTGKIVDFNWYFGASPRWNPIWSPDETQVYICCYFYGNAKTGQSYSISNENKILDGHQDDNMQSLHHSDGKWLNDNYVMAQFDGFFTYRDGPIPIFDISAKTFRNLGIIANLSDGFNTMPYTMPFFSPNHDYMWLSPSAQSPTDPQVYLVDLKTLKSRLYHSSKIEWSANGKYAILDSQILTLSNKELKALPANVSCGTWHPTKNICLSITTDAQQKQTLTLLDVQSLSVQKISLPPQTTFSRIIWSPTGDQIALITKDSAFWQIDYPKLENLEQLTPPMANVKDISWSPDGNSLSFIGDTDIYIVETHVKP
jgi:WD40 repeat protein